MYNTQEQRRVISLDETNSQGNGELTLNERFSLLHTPASPQSQHHRSPVKDTSFKVKLNDPSRTSRQIATQVSKAKRQAVVSQRRHITSPSVNSVQTINSPNTRGQGSNAYTPLYFRTKQNMRGGRGGIRGSSRGRGITRGFGRGGFGRGGFSGRGGFVGRGASRSSRLRTSMTLNNTVNNKTNFNNFNSTPQVKSGVKFGRGRGMRGRGRGAQRPTRGRGSTTRGAFTGRRGIGGRGASTNRGGSEAGNRNSRRNNSTNNLSEHQLNMDLDIFMKRNPVEQDLNDELEAFMSKTKNDANNVHANSSSSNNSNSNTNGSNPSLAAPS